MIFIRTDNTLTKVIKKITILIVTASMLTGCSSEMIPSLDSLPQPIRNVLQKNNEESYQHGQSGDGAKAPVENSITVYDTDGFEITTSESVIDMMEDTDDSEMKSATQLVSDNSGLINKENNNYCYSKMSDNSRKIYNEIYVILTEMEEDVLLSTTDKELIDYAFKCVLVDHPEIFYVTGYSISKYTMGDVIKKITFKGSYTMNSDMVQQKKSIVENYVDSCIAGISPDASDYDKITYVYEYLINHNDYDLESSDNQNILSVCENGRTVCQGYAKMTQLLLNRMGVFCTLVNGEASSGIRKGDDGTIYDNSGLAALADEDGDGWGAHVWNIVCCNGEYYNVDTTWGDASYMYTDAQGDGYVQGPDLNYDYLMIPDRLISPTHRANPVVDMPECVSMNDNYYVQEGLYFEAVNEGQLETAFEKAYAAGKTYETIKCADESIYNSMRDYLFKNENIFKYLNSNSVRYVEFTDRCALTIYL